MALTSRHLLWLALFCLLLSISANVYQYRSMAADESHRIVEKDAKKVLQKRQCQIRLCRLMNKSKNRNRSSLRARNASSRSPSHGRTGPIQRASDKPINICRSPSNGRCSRVAEAIVSSPPPSRTLKSSKSDDPEHCLVRFQRTLTIDANGYEETSEELVELTFTYQDGRYIVDQMKSLQTSGGV